MKGSKNPRKEQLRNLVNKINYMGHEVNLFIGKTVLAAGHDEKFANKYEVHPMEIRFYIHCIETKTTAYKSYDFVDFANICSDQMKMLVEFTELTNKLIEYTGNTRTSKITEIK